MKDNPQYDRQDCYFCHEQDTHILETHHVVPRRHGGADGGENLVTVCPTCHERLERLYNQRFYQSLGIDTDADNGQEGGEESEVTVVAMHSKEDDSQSVTVLDFIDHLENEFAEGAPVDVVIERATSRYDVTESQIKNSIDRLKQQGDVYEPQTDHLRTT